MKTSLPKETVISVVPHRLLKPSALNPRKHKRDEAKLLELEMEQHFTLTEDFLKGYRKEGLIGLLNDLGYNHDFSSMTSKGLIAFILSIVKNKPHLPKLVQFMNNDSPSDEAVEFKQAA